MSNKDNSEDMAISKRSFLQSVGMIGGSAAVMTAMNGWNMGFASEMEKPPELSSEGNGKTLIILGAGLAGMVMAYEMTKKGYKCKIIEALDYAGGRCVSARKGSVIEEIGADKQVCNFEDGNYINYGPWRIPVEHRSTIHYCRTLGIPLEVMINKANLAYYYSEKANSTLKGKPVRQVEAEIDFKGYTTELLAKVADQGKLDDMISEEDKEMLLEHLKNSGLVDKREFNYQASRARGYGVYPGGGETFGELSAPNSLAEALSMRQSSRSDTADHPPAMFQAVGGMDQIAKGLRKTLKRNTIKYNSEVTDIIQSEDEVVVTYKDRKSGKVKTIKGDYAISTIPLAVMARINTNLSDEYKQLMKATSVAPACKIGVEMNRRFWEEDEMIYGGVSKSDIEGHRVISYPSGGMFTDKGGVLLGYYPIGGQSVPVSNMSVQERIDFALECGEKIHPGKYKKHFTGEAMSVAWHKMPYAMCGWERWTRRGRTRQFPKFSQGEKRILFAGNIMSPALGGWMAGAIEGAWETMKLIDKRVSHV